MVKFNLSRLPFLDRVEGAALKAVEAEVEWFCLPAGATLFHEGETADAFYMVRSGALAAFRTSPDGRAELIGHIRQGEPIGEMALVEDRPHSASVYALRDSELVRLPKRAFEALTRRHPSLMRELARMMMFRLRGGSLRQGSDPKIFALITTSPTIDLDYRARELRRALESMGAKVEVLGEEAAGLSPQRIDVIEARHDVVVLAARLGDIDWAQRAMARADRIVILARADARPSTPLLPDSPSPAARLKLIDVVMVHHGGDRAAARPAEWVEAADAARCFHWRQGRSEDVYALARTLYGRSVGLVLSGGGSRAYAHVGAVRAFQDAKIRFDFFGGASMGAIIAAGAAQGWENAELEERMRAAFVTSNPLNDWTLPVVSLIRGKRVDKRLMEHFGDVDITDMPRPFFCVSSDLTSGSVRVHRRGRLRHALRASLAIPGLLPPVVDGQSVLVDGAVFNNFPVKEMKGFHRGVNIGSDVTRTNTISAADFIDPPGFFGWAMRHGLSDPPPIASLLLRAATAGTLDRHAATRDAADLLVLPELDMDLREWRRFDDAVDAGYNAATALIKALEPEDLARYRAGVA
ncbi:patatin-like phospholipase family protein [Alkalicaulis satelles]|uniref:patatin-like phospholipase family protein n=1 Tax=Alkalicaulis satelles TaxID=2609175 RepID=UPI001E5F8C95|nr:patatin-like phospholipase family protein [Alkalicaulis satelles]